MFVPESLKKQNDLIRTLQKQLEAKERELADEKWILQQYLQSPSWRMTSPLRWLARQLRAIRTFLFGGSEAVAEFAEAASPSAALNDAPGAVESEVSFDLKELFTSHYRVSLESFLASSARLRLPCSGFPEVSVILVLFNRAELTMACLRSLAENSTEQIEVIIVDNASTDGTSRLLNRLDGPRIIRNSENLHFLQGVNQAAKEARGNYLLLLNNDAQLMPGALQSALKSIRGRNDIGAVGGRIILFDGSLQEAGSIAWRDGSCLGYGRGDNPFSPVYMFQRDVDYCSGAFLLTPRATWEKLGGFDEVFKPAYYEETDYCMRLWANGLRVVYDPDAVILHYEFASSLSIQKATDLQRAHQLIFAKRHASSLQKHCMPDMNSILQARTYDKGQRRILFIDDRLPHPWLGSGFPRARALLTTLLKQGFFVTFYPLTHSNEDWAAVYSDMPRELEVMTGFGSALLEAFLRDRRGYYDSIIVSRPHNMKVLEHIISSYPEWFENTNVIYDAEALFVSREIGLRRLNGTMLTTDEADQMLKEEIALAAAADCVVAVSEHDRSTFETNGINRAYVLGHAISADSTPKSFDERSGFLFVGAIHEEISPNSDSVIWFIEEILPRIRTALGDAVDFTIAGINRSERIRKLAGAGVRITGQMEDLSTLYNDARVFVAPTRYAAGIPHKVHEAAARGLPVVVTPLLAAQLGWKHEMDLLVGDDAETFAKRCIDLHTNEALWMKMRDRGIESISQDCSVEVFESRLKEIMSADRTRFADVGMDR